MMSTSRSPLRLAVLMAAVALLAACGEGSTEPAAPGDGGTMTASIDGAPFVAATVEVRSGAPDTISVVGTSSLTESPVTQVSFFLRGVTGPGTYPLDATAFPTHLALVTVTASGAPSQWSTTQSTGPGSVTITSLSSEGATGTFQFLAEADPGTAAAGQVSVTSGAFSISF